MPEIEELQAVQHSALKAKLAWIVGIFTLVCIMVIVVPTAILLVSSCAVGDIEIRSVFGIFIGVGAAIGCIALVRQSYLTVKDNKNVRKDTFTKWSQ